MDSFDVKRFETRLDSFESQIEYVSRGLDFSHEAKLDQINRDYYRQKSRIDDLRKQVKTLRDDINEEMRRARGRQRSELDTTQYS